MGEVTHNPFAKIETAILQILEEELVKFSTHEILKAR